MLNLLVRVHSSTRSDNQLLAQEVSISGSGAGSIVTGVITDYSVPRQPLSKSMVQVLRPLYLELQHCCHGSCRFFQVDSKGMDLNRPYS